MRAALPTQWGPGSMARKLKIYTTSAGFFDLAIAAPSMKAALEAWGSRTNLFHQALPKYLTIRTRLLPRWPTPVSCCGEPSGRTTHSAKTPNSHELGHWQCQ
jgi:hypothetical protein